MNSEMAAAPSNQLDAAEDSGTAKNPIQTGYPMHEVLQRYPSGEEVDAKIDELLSIGGSHVVTGPVDWSPPRDTAVRVLEMIGEDQEPVWYWLLHQGTLRADDAVSIDTWVAGSDLINNLFGGIDHDGNTIPGSYAYDLGGDTYVEAVQENYNYDELFRALWTWDETWAQNWTYDDARAEILNDQFHDEVRHHAYNLLQGDAPDAPAWVLRALEPAPALQESRESSARYPHGLGSDFWDARPVLAHIRAAAQASIACPEAVLVAVQAEVLGHVMPNVVVPNVNKVGIGGTSINSLGAIVGPPGVGKDEAIKAALGAVEVVAAVDDGFGSMLVAPLRGGMGSGEGIGAKYVQMLAPRKDSDEAPDLKGNVAKARARLAAAKSAREDAKNGKQGYVEGHYVNLDNTKAIAEADQGVRTAQEGLTQALNAFANASDTGATVGPPELTQTAWKFVFTVSESDTVAALAGRTGNTLMPEIRKAVMGQQLGFDNREAITVAAGTYRYCGIVLGQPSKLGWLFDDAQGGTPQRFLWACAVDTDSPDNEPAHPGRWEVKLPPGSYDGGDQHQAPPGLGNLPWVVMGLCPEASSWVRDNRKRGLRGETLGEDAHAGIARLKFAAFLAILDSRLSISAQDWELARLFVEYSNRVRAWIHQTLDAANKTAAALAAVARGQAQLLQEATVTTGRSVSIEMGNTVLAVLAASPGGISGSDLVKNFGVAKRPLLPGVLASLSSNGHIRSEPGRKADSVRWFPV